MAVAGDIVDSVDGEPVRDLATANRLLRQPHRDITVRVLRMTETKFSAVRHGLGGKGLMGLNADGIGSGFKVKLHIGSWIDQGLHEL